jgi:hypothetical protein
MKTIRTVVALSFWVGIAEAARLAAAVRTGVELAKS